MTWQDLATAPWSYATIALGFAILLTLIPVLRKFTTKIELDAVKPWFDEANDLGEEKDRVANNFE